MIGATLEIVMNSENNLAAATPLATSAAMALASADPAATGRALQEAPDHQQTNAGRQRTQQRGDGADQGGADQQPAASPGVGHRAEQQLADHQPDDVRR